MRAIIESRVMEVSESPLLAGLITGVEYFYGALLNNNGEVRYEVTAMSYQGAYQALYRYLIGSKVRPEDMVAEQVDTTPAPEPVGRHFPSHLLPA